jgi:tetratricopeptide (TPR) repeat protein
MRRGGALSMKLLLSIVFILLISFLSAEAEVTYETIKLEVKFTEYNPGTAARPQIVVRDTLTAIKGKTLETFSGNLSLDILYQGQEDSIAKIDITYITLPPLSATKSNQIKSPLDVPFIIDSILVRGTQVYSVFFTPLEYGTMTTICEYDHRDEDVFYFDPTGDFDIYFVSNSLGDFHWNNIRDFLEYELDRFYKIYGFTQPGKINYYLYPCLASYYGFYKNSDFTIQPSRNSIIQEYSHLTVGIASPASNMTKLYRYWGYAPRMLVEGCAYITKFHQFYCQEYKKEEGLYPLEKMLKTSDYDNLENTHKKRMQAASLMSFLSKTLELNLFRDMYSQATDLNLKSKIEEYSGMSLKKLENDWLKYVDTAYFNPGLFHFFAQHEIAQSNIMEMVYLYEKALEYGANDSSFQEYLFNAYYVNGEYEKSAACVRKMFNYYSPERNQLPLANMLLSSGHVDSAKYYYQLAAKSDSANDLIPYKLGQIEFFQDNLSKSHEYFAKLIGTSQSIPFRIDGHYYIGRIHLLEGNSDSAEYYFTRALNGAKGLLSSSPDNPLYNLRAGEATIYLGEVDVALEYLKLAEYVELRPFYLGRILLNLGKAYDLSGDRNTAQKYYQHVIDIRSAYYDKADAQKFLNKPFKI